MNSKFVFLSLFLFVFSAITTTILYFYTQTPHVIEESEEKQVFAPTKLVEPTGSLYLSLKSPNDIYVTTYTIDVTDKNGFPKKYFENPYISRIGVTFIDPEKPNQYVANTVSKTSLEREDHTLLHYIDLDKNLLIPFQEVPGFNERHIDIDRATERVVYAKQEFNPETDEEFLDLQKWGVYVIDTKTGIENKIATGSYPVWSPDGSKILYLGVDGVHVLNLSNNTDKTIFPAEEGKKFGGEAMLRFSDSKRYFAWVIPAHHKFTTYQFDWETETVKLLYNIESQNTDYYWPTFSPDEQFLAIQAIERNDGERTGQRIEIWDMQGKVIQQHSLAGFDFMRAFTDDWSF